MSILVFNITSAKDSGVIKATIGFLLRCEDHLLTGVSLTPAGAFNFLSFFSFKAEPRPVSESER